MSEQRGGFRGCFGQQVRPAGGQGSGGWSLFGLNGLLSGSWVGFQQCSILDNELTDHFETSRCLL